VVFRPTFILDQADPLLNNNELCNCDKRKKESNVNSAFFENKAIFFDLNLVTKTPATAPYFELIRLSLISQPLFDLTTELAVALT